MTERRNRYSVYGLFFSVNCLLLATVCSYSQPAKQDMPVENYQKEYYSQVFGFAIPDEFNCRLYDEISSWLGTPYRYAGKNEKGIDCSGFVNRIYLNVYGLPLCGNSSVLYQSIDHIKKNKLKEGDLVFFKIHRKRISHVGIYLGENKFVHSSRTNGVIVSDLDDLYYKKRFICGGRLEDERLNAENGKLKTQN